MATAAATVARHHHGAGSVKQHQQSVSGAGDRDIWLWRHNIEHGVGGIIKRNGIAKASMAYGVASMAEMTRINGAATPWREMAAKIMAWRPSTARMK